MLERQQLFALTRNLCQPGEGGADVESVREHLGHRSLRATEKYLHTIPGHDHAALDAFEHVRNAA